MGIYFCKRPQSNLDHALSNDSLCHALTKWYGEEAFFAYAILLDDLSTSYISEVVKWKVCVYLPPTGYEYVELVLKKYPSTEARGQTFRSDVFFKNEITFYENTLPELLKFQTSREITGAFNNHLKLCLSYCDGKEDSIVFGDEFIQGFECPKSKFDLEHGKLVLKSLAQFHAMSFAMKEQTPKDFERICNEISETYYSDSYWGWYKRLWSQICSVAIDAVEKEYPNTKYVELIKKFAIHGRFKDLIKAVNDRENCVILHGDCRTNNFMFKYVEERPVDIKMLDFQQTRCASPVLDVCTLLYNNPELLKHEEELMMYYHGVLASRIQELGSKPDVYKWDVFTKEIEKYSYFGVAVSFETATTTLTTEEILDRVLALGWKGEECPIRNIADIYEVKNLENKERTDLANNFVHCIDKGYITGALLESSIFHYFY